MEIMLTKLKSFENLYQIYGEPSLQNDCEGGAEKTKDKISYH